MIVTVPELYSAEMAFKQAPQPATAAMFLSKLRDAKEIGLITDERFHDGLSDVESYLWNGGSVVFASEIVGRFA